ncbi:MAG: polysaccharide biosynthesis protein [Bacteroidales bacterium]|jgi:FlaA1/EpsC-like NDP-sugar epimerase|nr:polysaccharide biosynthesis protein [Bacteroidales bacterium]
MQKYFQKVLQQISIRYFSHWLVLFIDTFIAAACTLVACTVISYPVGSLPVAGELLFLFILSGFAGAVSSLLFRTYRHTIRYSKVKDLWRVGVSVLLKTLITAVLITLVSRWETLLPNQLLIFVIFDCTLSIIGLTGIRVMMILVFEQLMNIKSGDSKRILIYGVDNKSVALEMRLRQSRHYKVIGFYALNNSYKSYSIAGLPVFHFSDGHDFNKAVNEKNIQGILFARYEDAKRELNRLLGYCKQKGIETLIAPYISETSGNDMLKVKDIKIEDLLGREEIAMNTDDLVSNFRNKTVLITGAAGSIGSEICRQLAELGAKKLILYDSAETPLHDLRIELEQKFPLLDFVPVIGDVRIQPRVKMVFTQYHPQIVLHAAAYKHVPLMESNPCEAVLVNVTGTRLIADMSVEYGAEKMIMISSDKAVNPTNVMGASKRLAEIYVQSLGYAIEEGVIKGNTQFITTRFGNVLGSNGSVIPHFKKQIETGGPVTVTHPDIIRFFMTIPEACRLVLKAATIGKGNEIFVFKMGEAVKIVDLAKRMIKQSGYEPGRDIEIKFTGLRPGEKLYEEVLSTEENSLPTCHPKINIAKVRRYEYRSIIEPFDALHVLSYSVKIEDTVHLMKQLVPEFISQNSQFAIMDSQNSKLEWTTKSYG